MAELDLGHMQALRQSVHTCVSCNNSGDLTCGFRCAQCHEEYWHYICADPLADPKKFQDPMVVYLCEKCADTLEEEEGFVISHEDNECEDNEYEDDEYEDEEYECKCECTCGKSEDECECECTCCEQIEEQDIESFTGEDAFIESQCECDFCKETNEAVHTWDTWVPETHLQLHFKNAVDSHDGMLNRFLDTLAFHHSVAPMTTEEVINNRGMRTYVEIRKKD